MKLFHLNPKMSMRKSVSTYCYTVFRGKSMTRSYFVRSLKFYEHIKRM